MRVNFKKAIKELGAQEAGRWLLPDGTFITDGNDDHRIVGNYCRDSWIDFIYEGATSLHLDSKDHYLWIRTNQETTTAQRQAWERFFDEFGLHVYTLKIDIYNFETPCNFDIDVKYLYDEDLIRLYLTDRIGFECAGGFEQMEAER